ncbi:MAG: hypothetical protein ABIE84_06645, partial [bacterium]
YELKLGYGLTDPWDILGSFSSSTYPNVGNQNYQVVGLTFEYGFMKARYGKKPPFDISFLVGAENAQLLTSGTVISNETALNLGVLIGKSLVREVGAYVTPYFGLKGRFCNQSSFEAALGIKYGLTGALSLLLEGNYISVSNNNFGTGICFGVAWSI